MARSITLHLDAADVLQILDALENRAGSWERTAGLLAGEPEESTSLGLDDFFVPEECSDASEAEAISTHYRNIIAEIDRQYEPQ